MHELRGAGYHHAANAAALGTTRDELLLHVSPGRLLAIEDSYNRIIRDLEELQVFRHYFARNGQDAGLPAEAFTLIENHILFPPTPAHPM